MRNLAPVAGIGRVILEVDVQPFALGRTGLSGGFGDKPGSDPGTAVAPCDHGVQNERVDTAVPRDVHEADEITVMACTDPAEAVAVHPGQPFDIRDPMVESRCMQRIDGCVVEVATPLVRDRHGASVDRRPRLRSSSTAGPEMINVEKTSVRWERYPLVDERLATLNTTSRHKANTGRVARRTHQSKNRSNR